jgi:DNA polymerase III epsilon subunit-like protein
MIVLDTEGTDLLQPELRPIAEQPHLVEFAGVKLDNKLREVGRLRFLCKPELTALPELFTKITGITWEMVQDKEPFIAHYEELSEFFLGEREMVAHNMAYDSGMLRLSLTRIGRLLNFPWPIRHLCTVEISESIKGHRLSLSDLHLLAAGKKESDRVAFAPGQLVKHKSLGKCVIQEVQGSKLVVRTETKGQIKTLEASMFKGAAFEGAHGAMTDVEELVTIVRWLRKEGHL